MLTYAAALHNANDFLKDIGYTRMSAGQYKCLSCPAQVKTKASEGCKAWKNTLHRAAMRHPKLAAYATLHEQVKESPWAAVLASQACIAAVEHGRVARRAFKKILASQACIAAAWRGRVARTRVVAPLKEQKEQKVASATATLAGALYRFALRRRAQAELAKLVAEAEAKARRLSNAYGERMRKLPPLPASAIPCTRLRCVTLRSCLP